MNPYIECTMRKIKADVLYMKNSRHLQHEQAKKDSDAASAFWEKVLRMTPPQQAAEAGFECDCPKYGGSQCDEWSSRGFGVRTPNSIGLIFRRIPVRRHGVLHAQ